MAKKAPKGIYVGRFNEQECRDGIDKKVVFQKMEETGLKYTNTRFVKKRGEIVGLDVWVCNVHDCEF